MLVYELALGCSPFCKEGDGIGDETTTLEVAHTPSDAMHTPCDAMHTKRIE